MRIDYEDIDSDLKRLSYLVGYILEFVPDEENPDLIEEAKETAQKIYDKYEIVDDGVFGE